MSLARTGLRIIDLSMEVEEGTNPIYPEHAWLTYKPVAAHRTGAVFESNCVEMFLHAGSHIDAPYHFDPQGKTVDQIPLRQVVGPAIILNVSDAQPGKRIEAERLQTAKDTALAQGAIYDEGMIALVRTDWARKASPPDRRWWLDGPYLDKSAALWLVEQKFGSVGFDFPQDKTTSGIDRLMSLKAGGTRLDEMEDPPLPVHVALLTNGVCQIENITNLDQLPAAGVVIVAAPILLKGAEGGNARVFAIVFE